jgi:hypothetical protein
VDKRIDRLEQKLDNVTDKLNSIDRTLIANTVILEEHQRRSIANEAAVKLLETQVLPISKHVHTVGILSKVGLALLSSSVGLYLLQKIFKL